VAFLGSKVRYLVAVDDEQFTVDVQITGEEIGYDEGEQVTVVWHPDRTQAIEV